MWTGRRGQTLIRGIPVASPSYITAGEPEHAADSPGTLGCVSFPRIHSDRTSSWCSTWAPATQYRRPNFAAVQGHAMTAGEHVRLAIFRCSARLLAMAEQPWTCSLPHVLSRGAC